MAEETWQQGMLRAVALYVFQNGQLTQKGITSGLPRRGDHGGFWEDFQDDWEIQPNRVGVTAHIRDCGPDVSKTSYEDSEWWVFDGTFAEPAFSRSTGLDLTSSCACGRVKERRWRYEGTMAALIKGIT